MLTDLTTILFSALALAAGIIATAFILKPKKIDLESLKQTGEAAIAQAQEQAQKTKEEAKARIENLKSHKQESEERLAGQFKRIESLITSKEEQLTKKQQKNQEIKTVIDQEVKLLNELKEKNRHSKQEYTLKLGQRSGITIESAKEHIQQDYQRDLELMCEDRLRKYEEYLKEEKIRIAKNMITTAIQRYSAPTSVEKLSTEMTVERDEAKGRIVGKGAENLLLLEELTGVDIIFNDSPGSIIVSCFDLVRRHIARLTIEKLTRERIITPDKIRQKLDEAKLEMEKILIRSGRQTIKSLDLDNRKLPDDFARIVGRLQFRTSYGQNILRHSSEVGNFTLMLGSELGLNMETCKVGGFFHDLGKAIDQEVGGSHDFLTKEIMEKFVFPEREIHAAWAHHDAIPQETAEAMLVKAGDAISAGRPGARQESIEKYIERIKAIESISSSYEGVNKVYAISAGREVRVIVEPQTLSDSDLPDLAKNIAVEIQGNVAYPGKIKVNVIRRTQSIDYVKMAGAAGLLPTKKKHKPDRATPINN